MMASIDKIRRSSLFKGFVATMLGSGMSKFVLVITTFICSNLLTKLEFGELSFVRNTLNMILCICALNFSSLCTKFITEAKEDNQGLYRLIWLFAFSFFICVILGFFLLILPDSVMQKMLESGYLVKFFRIIGVLLPLFIISPLVEGIFRGQKRFKLIGYLQVSFALFFLMSLYFGIIVGGVNGAIIGVLLYYTLYSLVCLFIVFRISSLRGLFARLRGFKSEIMVVPKMILPVFIMSFIEAPVFWIVQVIVAQYGSMESIGSITAILQIRNFGMLIPTYFANTYIAFAGELNAQKRYDAYFSQFDKLIKSYLIVGMLLAILFSLLSIPFLSLYGNAYVCDWPAMIIANVSLPLFMLVGLIRISLVLQEHQGEMLYISIIWNLFWILGLFMLLEKNTVPVNAFFISQFGGVLVCLIIMYNLYNRDKRKMDNSII